jgi:Family of unknown function (DUF5681)
MGGKAKKQYNENYRVPPEASRWKKGQSGNPAGRPKKPPPETDTGKILQAISNEMVETTVRNKPKLMRRGEFRFLQLFTRAIEGNLAAAEQIEKMAADYLRPEDKVAAGYRFVVMPDYYFHRAHREMSASECREVTKRLKKIQAEANEPELVSDEFMFRKIAQEEEPVEIDGKRAKITRWQLYLRRIYIMTLSGSNRASRMLHRLQKQYPGDAPSGPVITYLITEGDAKL